ncbi:MAG: hypothetical protein ACTS4W_00445 [Candidatus Hodgkinia cicadicola]
MQIWKRKKRERRKSREYNLLTKHVRFGRSNLWFEHFRDCDRHSKA